MRKLLLAAAMLACVLRGSTQPTDARVGRIDSILREAVEREDFNGNVLVAEGDRIVYQKSFGKADFHSGRMLDNETIFELASVSKQFTAMGIVMLVHQGRLSFDDSLRKFFPSLPYSQISVRHLLHHSSGLPDYMDLFEKHWDSTRIATNRDFIQMMTTHQPPVKFPPGQRWDYSNTGYVFLAAIIEAVSGKPFAAFMKEQIFDPLGMTRTMVFSRRFEGRVPENYALGFIFDSDKGEYVLPDAYPPLASMVYSLDGIHGDGCVNSTTGDLFRWHTALSSGRLVPPALIREAFTPGPVREGKSNYGFGWVILPSKTFGTIVNHGGSWPGYATYLERHLDTDRLIVVLQNTGRRPLRVNSLRAIAANTEPERLVAQPMTTAEMEEYLGTYEMSQGFSIKILVQDEKLYVQGSGQEPRELFREDGDLFFLTIADVKIRFTRNGDGKVNALMVQQNGVEVEGKRKDQ